MRTPGHDPELAAGFMLGEGMVHTAADIESITHCGPASGDLGLRNVIESGAPHGRSVRLGQTRASLLHVVQLRGLRQVVFDALRVTCSGPLSAGPRLDPATVSSLPGKLRSAQSVFEATGGLHQPALFTADGALVTLREDVGLHNAVDKVIGSELLGGRLPCTDRMMLVSGRASLSSCRSV